MTELEKLIANAVGATKLRLWGIDLKGRATIYIDSDDKVTAQDCQSTARHIRGVLAAEGDKYKNLDFDVSSPGIDRQFFKPEQYSSYIGQRVKLKCFEPVAEANNFDGELIAVNEDAVEVKVDGEVLVVPFANIKKANLIAQI